MANLTLQQQIEIQFNEARTIAEKWIIDGCNKKLQLKFPRNLIEVTYNGKLNFALKLGIGTGKTWKNFDTLLEAVVLIGGSLGTGFIGSNGFELVTELK